MPPSLNRWRSLYHHHQSLCVELYPLPATPWPPGHSDRILPERLVAHRCHCLPLVARALSAIPLLPVLTVATACHRWPVPSLPFRFCPCHPYCHPCLYVPDFVHRCHQSLCVELHFLPLVPLAPDSTRRSLLPLAPAHHFSHLLQRWSSAIHCVVGLELWYQNRHHRMGCTSTK